MALKSAARYAVKQNGRVHVIRRKLLSWKVLLPVASVMVLMLAIFIPTGTEDSGTVVMAAGSTVPHVQSSAALRYLNAVTTSVVKGKKGTVQPVSTEFSEQEIEWLATLIYYEISPGEGMQFASGSSWSTSASEAARQLTAVVPINRVRCNWSSFAETDTLEKVLKRQGQYGYFDTYELACAKKAKGADMTASYIFYPQFGKDYAALKVSDPKGLAICEASARVAASGQTVDENGNPVPANVLYEHSFPASNAVVPASLPYRAWKGPFWICYDPRYQG